MNDREHRQYFTRRKQLVELFQKDGWGFGLHAVRFFDNSRSMDFIRKVKATDLHGKKFEQGIDAVTSRPNFFDITVFRAPLERLALSDWGTYMIPGDNEKSFQYEECGQHIFKELANRERGRLLIALSRGEHNDSS